LGIDYKPCDFLKKGENHMQNPIDEALKEFESVFSRHSNWLLFCAIVIGFARNARNDGE
jgi:hypothetical protein